MFSEIAEFARTCSACAAAALCSRRGKTTTGMNAPYKRAAQAGWILVSVMTLAMLIAIPVKAADPPPPFEGQYCIFCGGSPTSLHLTPGEPVTITLNLGSGPDIFGDQSVCQVTYTFGGSALYTATGGSNGVYIPGAITSSSDSATLVVPAGGQGHMTITYTLTKLPIPPPLPAGTSAYSLETYGTAVLGPCLFGVQPGGSGQIILMYVNSVFDAGSSQPLPLECPQSNGPSTQVGDPCDVANQEFYQSETDYEGAGLRFTRYYHSTQGAGWNHSYAAYLAFSSGVPAALVRPDGHYDAVSLVNGEYVSLSGAGIHVQASGSNWVAYLSDGSSEVYNGSGQLTQLVNPTGQVTTLTYSSLGLLSQVSDPFGHVLTLGYDSDNRLSTLTEPDGVSKVTYAYDGINDLLSVTYPDSTVRRYQYQSGSLPKLTGITDESGTQFMSVGYDPSTGAVTSSQNAGGANAVALAYGANAATVTDSLGGTTVYAFTTDPGSSPRVTSVTRNSLPAQTYAVPAASADPQRRVTQSTDPNGNVTTYTYDTDHLTSKTEALGTGRARTTSYQYLATNTALPTLITEALKKTAYTYSPSTNLVQTKTVTDTTATPNVTRTWTYTYDSYGRVLSAQGPRTDVNSTSTYAYYTCTTGAQCGQLQTITDPVGNVTTYNTYNAHGQPLTLTDPNGVVTTLAYDARQRLTSRQVGTELTSFSYYPTGLLKQVTLPDNSFAVYTYDGAHRLTQMSDELGNKIIYTLDGMGNRIAENSYDVSDVLHRTHSRVVNALNELYQDVNAAGTGAVTTTYGYDNNGNQTSISGPLARNSSNTYDELNRLSRITDPDSGITQLTYDSNDESTAVTDPRNLTTSYDRNGFGDLTTYVSPDAGTTGYAYDSAGNLATSTDARGALATYTYDAANRPTKVVYSSSGVADQTILLAYDVGPNGKGHLTGVSDANHVLSWSYDVLGRVITKAQTAGTVVLSTGYGYTNADLTTVTTPSGRTITYGYNANHQIVSVALNGVATILTNVTYEPFGPVNGWTWGNGTTATRTYDTDGDVVQITSAGTKTYSYDSALRITGIADAGNPALSWTYDNDVLDRLTSAVSAAQTQGFTYDANGNRLSEAGTSAVAYVIAANSNHLTATSGGLTRSYGYDAAGNVLSYSGLLLSYNNAGRLASATVGSTVATYKYDALGERIAKTVGSTTTYFAYDLGGHLLGEYDASGALIQEIVWMGDTPVASLRPTACGLGLFYIHTDHLNRPRIITRRSTADVVWRWDSDPYGSVLPNENPSGLGTFRFNLRFPGQYFDAETGLNYNYFRDYDSAVGSYVEGDPIGLKGLSFSMYAYVGDRPLSSWDSLGLAPCGRPNTCVPRSEVVAWICKLLADSAFDLQKASVVAYNMREADNGRNDNPVWREGENWLTSAAWDRWYDPQAYVMNIYLWQYFKYLPGAKEAYSNDALNAGLDGHKHANQSKDDLKKWCRDCGK